MMVSFLPQAPSEPEQGSPSRQSPGVLTDKTRLKRPVGSNHVAVVTDERAQKRPRCDIKKNISQTVNHSKVLQNRLYL